MTDRYGSQRGAVLIAMLCGVLLVTGVSMLGGHLAISLRQQTQNEVTQSLARAKQALISYAVNYVDNYGHNTRGGVGRLPCPAVAPHSRPAMSCGENAVGFLPAVWNRKGKRIDIDHLEYFLDQNLWYAVSADYRYNPAFNTLNPDTGGRFLSVNNHNEVVAVIMHPGKALGNQLRNNQLYGVLEYLEGANANGDDHFEIDSQSNDQLVFIRRNELMPLIERRVLGMSRDWLNEYQRTYGYLPFAARLGDPLATCEQGLTTGTLAMLRGNCTSPALGELISEYVPKGRSVRETWFGKYGWAAFTYYHVDPSCVVGAENLCTNPLQPQPDHELRVNGAPARALLVSTGRAIKSAHLGEIQDRYNHPSEMSSYLDTTELVNGSFDFSHLDLVPASASNDQFLVLR